MKSRKYSKLLWSIIGALALCGIAFGVWFGFFREQQRIDAAVRPFIAAEVELRKAIYSALDDSDFNRMDQLLYLANHLKLQGFVAAALEASNQDLGSFISNEDQKKLAAAAIQKGRLELNSQLPKPKDGKQPNSRVTGNDVANALRSRKHLSDHEWNSLMLSLNAELSPDVYSKLVATQKRLSVQRAFLR